MPGLSPKLPIQHDAADGIGLNKTFEEVVKQNIKMILLTNPGEKIMDPNFGVGMLHFLFENQGRQTYDLIETRITEQLEIYYPFVEIIDLKINPDEDSFNKPSTLTILLRYLILSTSLKDSLEIILDIPDF